MQLSPVVAAASSSSSVRLRPGQPSDRGKLWRMVLAEKLNPTGLDPARFTIAERTAADGSSRIVGVGQLKPLSGGAALELASLVVSPEERGNGVGSQLVRSLVQRAGSTPIYLTTISQRMALYQRCGFEEVPRSEVPLFLQMEYFAGIALAWLVARDRLVLMRLTQQQQQQQARAQAAGAGSERSSGGRRGGGRAAAAGGTMSNEVPICI